MRKVHELKIHPDYFESVKSRSKLFECRFNDRDFKVNDILILKEFNTETQQYTGREISVLVIYMLENWIGLKEGYVIMSVLLLDI